MAERVKAAYRITANDRDATAAIADHFKSLTLTDDSGLESDTLEIELDDSDPLRPIEKPADGAELELWLGWDGEPMTRMGLYVLDEVAFSGWPQTMTLRARAAIYEDTPKGKTDLLTQKSRSWPLGTQLGTMVAKIAKEHGLEPAVAPSLSATVLPHLDQTAESDISFLVRVLAKYDALVKPAGGKLIIAKRGESRTASGADLPAITVHANSVTRFETVQAAREAVGTVVAFWHSVRNARRIPVTVGSGEPVRQLRHYFPTESAARSAAQAELDKRTRAQTRLALALPGDARLIAEVQLLAEGFRKGVAGAWLVKRVTHYLDGATQGWSCDVEAEKPADAE